jgi:hypothetical protein
MGLYSDSEHINRNLLFSKDILRIPIRLNELRYERAIVTIKDYRYNIWLIELARKSEKNRKSLTYKLNKIFTGFSVSGYELEPNIGSLISVALRKNEFNFIAGIDTKVLFHNGLKLVSGLKWSTYNGEFKPGEIEKNDFPPAPENEDIFDGINVNESYFILPVGLEYHFYHSKSIHPYVGLGWALRFGIKNSYEYEFHDIETYKEYNITKVFNKSLESENYWLKSGISYDFNYNFGSAIEASYYFGPNDYKYTHNRLRALIFTLNMHYRF